MGEFGNRALPLIYETQANFQGCDLLSSSVLSSSSALTLLLTLDVICSFLVCVTFYPGSICTSQFLLPIPHPNACEIPFWKGSSHLIKYCAHFRLYFPLPTLGKKSLSLICFFFFLFLYFPFLSSHPLQCNTLSACYILLYSLTPLAHSFLSPSYLVSILKNQWLKSIFFSLI